MLWLEMARLILPAVGMNHAATTSPPQSSRSKWFAGLRSILALLLAVLGVHSLIAKPFYIPSESMMPGLLVGDRLLVTKYPFGWSYISPSFHVIPFIKGRLFGRLPERGDVVIVTPPGPSRGSEDLIKRVIGLPGDVVQMIDGRLWLNGKPVPAVDLGTRDMPIDGNFHCDPNDPDPERAFPSFAGARVFDKVGRPRCRLHIIRETLPGGRSYETIDFGRGSEDDTMLWTVPPDHVFLLGDNRDNSADSRVPSSLNGLGGVVPMENLGGRAEFITFLRNGNASWNPLTW